MTPISASKNCSLSVPKSRHRLEMFGRNLLRMSLMLGASLFAFGVSRLNTRASSSQEEGVRIDKLAERIGAIQCLKSSFQPILNIILLSLDAPPVFMRTKALRALGQIVMSDPTILSTVCVQWLFRYIFGTDTLV